MLPTHVHVGFGEIGVCKYVKSVDQDRWFECKMIIINVQYVFYSSVRWNKIPAKEHLGNFDVL